MGLVMNLLLYEYFVHCSSFCGKNLHINYTKLFYADKVFLFDVQPAIAVSIREQLYEVRYTFLS